MRVLIICLLLICCLIFVGCSLDNSNSQVVPQITQTVALSGINIFKEYHLNYSIVDNVPARCRWLNRDDYSSYGSFDLARNIIEVHGDQTVSSDDFVGGTHISYVKHYSGDKNFFSYYDVNERWVDSCNYYGTLFIDSLVCETANNNSSAVCYNLSGDCDLKLWFDEPDNSAFLFSWSNGALNYAVRTCIHNFDMVQEG